ncbi:MAG: hypothetical protein GWP10_21955, partial [Nitrospiraceae bacterium]|nr:hypothetical protein [Nitrospiraceae bacterium]
ATCDRVADTGCIFVPVQLPGYADPVAVAGMSVRGMVGVFSILRWGLDGFKYYG